MGDEGRTEAASRPQIWPVGFRDAPRPREQFALLGDPQASDIFEEIQKFPSARHLLRRPLKRFTPLGNVELFCFLLIFQNEPGATPIGMVFSLQRQAK